MGFWSFEVSIDAINLFIAQMSLGRNKSFYCRLQQLISPNSYFQNTQICSQWWWDYFVLLGLIPKSEYIVKWIETQGDKIKKKKIFF